ncbi:hypothetical protein QUC31_015678 [Theobroma cacao]
MDKLDYSKERLPLVDRVHSSVVCKQWSSALKRAPRPARNLLHLDDDSKDWDHMIITYFDLSEGTIGNLNLCEPIPNGDATGASKDWLVEPTKGTTSNNLQTFLLHPISGVQIPLAPLSTIRSASGDSKPQSPYDRVATFQVFKVEASDALCLRKLSNQTLFIDGADARLPLVDRVHASIVCKQWSSALKQTPRPTWILLHQLDDYTKDCDHMVISYFDLGDGAIGNMNLPESTPEGATTGASKGWLAVHMVGTTTNNLRTFLLDPISGVQLPLPPMSTTRSASEDTNIVFPNIEISSQDASKSVVAAIFGDEKILALCRPKDKRWTLFEGLDIADDYRYVSISFCDGKLYALITTETDVISLQIQTHSIKLTDGHHVLLKLIPFPMFKISSLIFFEYPVGEAGLSDENWMVIPYLVDSNGELLLVLKILDDKGDHNDELQTPYYRVATFEVFKVEASDTLCLTRLSNLDDQALFVDGVDAISFTGENCSRNCIYFLEDSFLYTDQGPKPISSPRSGVFYLNDGKIERFFPDENIAHRVFSKWFIPNIKIGGFN